MNAENTFNWLEAPSIACLFQNIFYPQLLVIGILFQLLRHHCALGIIWPHRTVVISVEAGRTALLFTKWCRARVWKTKPPPSRLNGELRLIGVDVVGINTQHFPSLMSCPNTDLMCKDMFFNAHIHIYTYMWGHTHTSAFTSLTLTVKMGCV